MGLAAAGAIAGIAGGVAGVANAAGSLIGGNKAAGGAGQSQYLQALEMNQNIVNTAPFIGAGQYGVNAVKSGLESGRFGTPMDLSGMPTAAQVPQYTGGPPPTAPDAFAWNPTQAGLAATPGYQFTLQQAKQAQESSAAARGLGVSSASLRGAADYATGLADKTYNEQLQNAINIYGTGLNRYDRQLAGYGQGLNEYDRQLAGFTQQAGAFQNQFNDYWGNQTPAFNQLLQLGQLGANSATGQGTSGTTAAQNIGNAALAQGQYQGAGIAQAGNALAGTLNSPGVQTLLQGSGSNANNQSVTGGGIFNSFSGIGPYTGGYGSYYQPPNPIDPANYAQGAQTGGLL